MSTDAIELALIEVINELITLKRRNRRPKKLWMKSWIERRNHLGISNTLLKELASEDTSSYFNFLRINEEMFIVLLQKVAPKIQKQNTIMRDALPAKLKLEVTLRYLATGDSYKTLQYIYRVGKSSISEFIPEVFNAIFEELKEFIEVPREKSKWNKIMDGFNSMWNFPNCIGAIDGKHIVMECPANSGSNYFNYKGTFSIVLLALVDHNYNFTCIDIGSYGSNSDGGIFNKSALKKAIEEHILDTPTDSVILRDDAFPLLPYLMKPFARRNHLTEREKVYNYRHCSARRIVENGFGILSSRFRVFRRPITLTPENTIHLVKAACALHNWIRKNGKDPNSISVDIEDTETGRLLHGSWRNDTSVLTGAPAFRSECPCADTSEPTPPASDPCWHEDRAPVTPLPEFRTRGYCRRLSELLLVLTPSSWPQTLSSVLRPRDPPVWCARLPSRRRRTPCGTHRRSGWRRPARPLP